MKEFGIFRSLLLFLALLYIPEALGFRFQIVDKGNEFPSIMLDIDFKMTITAFKSGQQISQTIHQTSDAQFANITGNSGTKGVLSVQFQDSINWKFTFRLAGGTVYMNRFIKFIPSQLFPESSISSTLEYRYPEETDVGWWTNSYECNKPVVTNYIPERPPTTDIIFEVKTVVRNFKTQAFSIMNGLYSKAGHCNGDWKETTLPVPTTKPTTTTTTTTTTQSTTTTTKPTSTTTKLSTTTTTTQSSTTTMPTTTTTPLPTTTTKLTTTTTTTQPTTTTTKLTTTVARPLPRAKLNTYVVQDEDDPRVFCIVFAGKVEFEIVYALNTKMEAVDQLVKVGVPDEYTATGKCKGDQQRLTVTFNNDWTMTLLFAKANPYFHEALKTDSKNGSKSGLAYSVANVSLTYTVDEKWFPNTVESRGTRHVVAVPREDATNLPTKTSDQSYYQCSSGSRVRLGRNTMINLTSIKFKAFNHNSDVSFKGEPAECKADIKPKHEANLAVIGITVLVIFGTIALIAVVTLALKKRRRKNRRGYKAIR